MEERWTTIRKEQKKKSRKLRSRDEKERETERKTEYGLRGIEAG